MEEEEKQAQADGKGAAPEAGAEPEGGSEGAPGAEAEPEGDDDIAKLKSECPFLFETKQTGSTGLKPEGGAGKDDEELVDRILGRFK